MNDLKDVFGKFIGFYYVSSEHLIVNLDTYIKAGLANNEKVYIFSSPTVKKQISNSFKEAINNQIFYLNVHDIINNEKIKTKPFNVYNFYNLFEDFIQITLKQGYSGVRWIGHVNYVCDNFSEELMFSWIKSIQFILKESNVSCLCCYDFWDYLNEQKIITADIIKESYKIHDYILNEFNLKKL